MTVTLALAATVALATTACQDDGPIAGGGTPIAGGDANSPDMSASAATSTPADAPPAPRLPNAKSAVALAAAYDNPHSGLWKDCASIESGITERFMSSAEEKGRAGGAYQAGDTFCSVMLATTAQTRQESPDPSEFECGVGHECRIGEVTVNGQTAYVHKTLLPGGDPNHDMRTTLVITDRKWQIDAVCLWDKSIEDWNYCT